MYENFSKLKGKFIKKTNAKNTKEMGKGIRGSTLVFKFFIKIIDKLDKSKKIGKGANVLKKNNNNVFIFNFISN